MKPWEGGTPPCPPKCHFGRSATAGCNNCIAARVTRPARTVAQHSRRSPPREPSGLTHPQTPLAPFRFGGMNPPVITDPPEPPPPSARGCPVPLGRTRACQQWPGTQKWMRCAPGQKPMRNPNEDAAQIFLAVAPAAADAYDAKEEKWTILFPTARP